MKKKFILIAEDEEIVKVISVEMLSNLGFEVLSVSNGLDAVEVFKKNRENIFFVILDIVMPKMNGEETFHALKLINPDIKVLFSSGFSRNTRIDILLRNKGTGFIHKPFRQSELSEKIEEILSS